MKITIVCDGISSKVKGSSVAAMTLVRALRKRGHEAVVVCSDIEKTGKEGFVVIPRRGIGKGNSSNAQLLESAVWDSDAVHIMTASALGRTAVKMCKKHLIPVSVDYIAEPRRVSARTGPNHSKAEKSVIYRRLYRELYRHADAVRYPSELSRRLFEKTVGHKTNAYIIPNGVDERFCPNEAQKPLALRNRFVILYRADFGKGKGHGTLIDAVALSKYSDKIQLILSGSGPLKGALKKRGEKLKYRPILTDYPYSQLPNLYNCADLYVHPALVDIHADSCIEALACGLVPLIADSPYSAAKSLAPDNGCLFESGNARALAEKIDGFIEHPERIQAFREKYAGIAENLTQDTCADRMEEMLYNIR